MDILAAKLGCRDDIGGRFELSKLSSNISERMSRNANNENNVRKLLIDHGIDPLEALEQMPTYLHIYVNVLVDLTALFAPNTDAIRFLLLSRWWTRNDLEPIELAVQDIVEQVGIKTATILFADGGFYGRQASRSFHICLARLVESVGLANAARLFATHSFCTRIRNNLDFTILFDAMKRADSKTATQLFSSGSFCTRIGVDLAFTDLFNTTKRADSKTATRLFSTDSFCTRIGVDLAFTDHFNAMKRADSKTATRLFSTDTFCTRIVRGLLS